MPQNGQNYNDRNIYDDHGNEGDNIEDLIIDENENHFWTETGETTRQGLVIFYKDNTNQRFVFRIYDKIHWLKIL